MFLFLQRVRSLFSRAIERRRYPLDPFSFSLLLPLLIWILLHLPSCTRPLTLRMKTRCSPPSEIQRVGVVVVIIIIIIMCIRRLLSCLYSSSKNSLIFPPTFSVDLLVDAFKLLSVSPMDHHMSLSREPPPLESPSSPPLPIPVKSGPAF